MARDRTRLKLVFTRCIAAKPRMCSECEDLAADEGSVYYKDKTGAIWCPTCHDYEREKLESD